MRADRGPILVVSASAGTGHVRAGEAVRDGLAALGEEAEHVDVLSLAPRLVRAAYGGGFELVARRAPSLWREVHQLADGTDADPARWAPLVRAVLFREFQRLLTSRPWRACVCTHFLPAQLAAGRGGHGVPFSLVVTDFELHRYWAQRRVRDYYVAHEGLGAALRERLPQARVTVTGIPIDLSFAAPPRWRAARAQFGLQPKGPVVLVMGGGMGLGLEENVQAALAARVPDLQAVAVCGRNRSAAEALRRRGIAPHRLVVLDCVKDVAALMAGSDVVVSKPGGLTVSEALGLGRPLVLSRPIPGHEEANARLVTSLGAGLQATSASAVTRALEQLFHAPSAWAAAAAAARVLGRPRAALDVARGVRERVDLPAVA